MNVWDVLEIDATQDVSVIKKAYAKKLKLHHPEEDPSGYQNLREAYDCAIQYAKHAVAYFHVSVTENEAEQSDGGPVEKESSFLPDAIETEMLKSDPIFLNDEMGIEHLWAKPVPLYEELAEEPRKPDFQNLNEEFIKKIEDLYADFSRRIDIRHWIDLFDCEVIWNMYNREELCEIVLNFLYSHRNLPQNIWVFLNLSFDWVNQRDGIYSTYEDLVEYIKERLQAKESLSYCFGEGIEKIDYDTYLNFREAAYNAAEKYDFMKAYSFLKKAKSLYPYDPELLFIQGKCLLYIRKMNDAFEYFNALINKVPNHIPGLLYRAQIYMGKQQYRLALEDLKKVESYSPDNEEMLYRIARCYRMLKDLHLAKDYAQKLSMISPKYEGLDELIMRINKSICFKLKLKITINPFNRSLWEQYKTLKK